LIKLVENNVLVLEKTALDCVIAERINRFTVKVMIGRSTRYAHTNNTGQLRDLLVNGRRAYCYEINGSKLNCRIYAVEERYGFAIIDTLLQEKIFETIVREGLLSVFGTCHSIKGKPRVKNRTYDYLLSCEKTSFLVEIKSATMRLKEIYASYPDTRTDRGVKHIMYLPDDAKSIGAIPVLVFIAGLRSVEAVVPNYIAEPRILNAIDASTKKGLLVQGLSIYVSDEDPQKIIVDKQNLPIIMAPL
jgi:sugar fermentation stimulation protein A